MAAAQRERQGARSDGRRRGTRPPVRVPEVALGVVLVVGGALAAVVWHATGERTRPVLVAARDVPRGDVLDRDDLRAVEVHVPDGVAVVAATSSAGLIGKVAVADLAAGTLVSPSVVADRPVAGMADRVVGVAVQPGDAPARLRRGDRVDAIRTPAAGGLPGDAAAPEVLVAGAVVADVDRSTDPTRPVQVALIVPRDAAPSVAAAVAARQLRLAVVGVAATTGTSP
jgi:hypothetical protein